MELSHEALVREIALLDRRRAYPYVNPRTKTMVRIKEVHEPFGPVVLVRTVIKAGRRQSRNISISANTLASLAAALSTGMPINVNAALYDSGNGRSAIEAIVACVPPVFVTFPNLKAGEAGGHQIRRKVKHLVLHPYRVHPPGVIEFCDAGDILEEKATAPEKREAKAPAAPGSSMAIPPGHSLRRHSRIQESLVLFGSRLGNSIWIDRSDWGVCGSLGKISDLDGVLQPGDLARVPFLAGREATEAITHIDCAWLSPGFSGFEAAFEIEETTRITSGLTRFMRLWFALPEGLRHRVRWTIVASDSDRDKVCRIASREQFRPLDAWFLPYSGVEDFRQLCDRRGLKGASSEFLENFMTRVRQD